MNFHKSEKIREVLTEPHGVDCVTAVGEKCVERWRRRVNGEEFSTAVTWEDPEQILPEESLAKALGALFVSPVILQIKSIGGLYL